MLVFTDLGDGRTAEMFARARPLATAGRPGSWLTN
jgi:hypothetical protein